MPATTASLLQLMPRLLGVLLLVAAILKAQGLGVAPISPMGLLSATWFQVALIEGELLLGLWLTSGASPVGAWAVAVVAFTCFSMGLAYQAAAKFFGCLAIALLAFTAFVAPDRPAFADFGTDAGATCAANYHMGDWDSYMRTCCWPQCTLQYGSSGPDYDNCMNECTAAGPAASACDSGCKAETDPAVNCGFGANWCTALTGCSVYACVDGSAKTSGFPPCACNNPR